MRAQRATPWTSTFTSIGFSKSESEPMNEHIHDHDDAPHAHPHAPPAKDEKIHSYHQVLGLALKELLIEKGIFSADEVRKAIEARDAITPALGAAIIARAWTDP